MSRVGIITLYRSSTNEVPEYTTPSIPRPFKSYKLKGEFEKPWLSDRHYTKRERADKFILGFCSLIGFAIAAFFCYDGWTSLPNNDVSCCATVLN